MTHELEKHVTSKDTSKKLKESGFDIESHYIWVHNLIKGKWQLYDAKYLNGIGYAGFLKDKIYPAYLATELFLVFNSQFHLVIEYYPGSWRPFNIAVDCGESADYLTTIEGVTLEDTLAETILWLIENKYLEVKK
jgi:hypothetical protein